MADDPKGEKPDDKPDDEPKVFTRPEDEAGKKALEAERKARREAEQQLKALQDRLDELESKDKSEVEKANEKAVKAEKRAEEAEAKAIRMEIATSKGLTPAQAKRLVGATKEELEADADELLDSFKPEDKPSPSGRPKERLRPGAVPDAEPEETDPRKLAEAVPRT
jgi:hypothetical protein